MDDIVKLAMANGPKCRTATAGWHLMRVVSGACVTTERKL